MNSNKTRLNFKHYRSKIAPSVLLIGLIIYALALPKVLFSVDYSTVLLDREGKLLGAKIASDGQWRFPESDSIPKKFETCLIQFEDKNFYQHIGISAKGMARAMYQNIKNKKIVSGASTISMQTIRLMRKNPKRTLTEKLLEMALATRLEIRYSKKEILNFYASHAPFGNNVVGLEAASWRYFGRSSFQLSWAESATLAVLPNAPGLIYPGKNHDRLLNKRNRLLKRLFTEHLLDSTEYLLAIEEQLPGKPLQLPQFAPHLLQKYIASGYKGKIVRSDINLELQEQVKLILNQHLLQMTGNKIFNGAIIISSSKTGEILAYVGNTESLGKEHANDVDCIQAPRSSGSILKPLLFEKSLECGVINPHTILPDIPCQFGKFSPKNYNKSYDGAVAANEVLSRSLNIPMVNLLNDYGLAKFHNDLKNLGFKTICKSSVHYGLSLILGGAEVSLWDLHNVYTQMALQLNNNTNNNKSFPMDKGCIYSTFEAMSELNRPDEEGNWKAFESSKKIAWKTGTSFGNRDAWAIGITPDYVVSIWTGNADGEGRTGLVGVKTSAPILFDIFSILPSKTKWFTIPYSDMVKIELCRESGFRASENCPNIDTSLVPTKCLQSLACPYHKVILLDKLKKFRVDSDCESFENIQHQVFFVLPPLVEKYYKQSHPNFIAVPNYKADCLSKVADKSMYLIYPKKDAKIIIPIQIDETKGRTVFEATHKNPSIKIYWHLDNEFIGTTTQIHQITLNPSEGKHLLTIIDENGVSQNCNFEVVGENNLAQ